MFGPILYARQNISYSMILLRSGLPGLQIAILLDHL